MQVTTVGAVTYTLANNKLTCTRNEGGTAWLTCGVQEITAPAEILAGVLLHEVMYDATCDQYEPGTVIATKTTHAKSATKATQVDHLWAIEHHHEWEPQWQSAKRAYVSVQQAVAELLGCNGDNTAEDESPQPLAIWVDCWVDTAATHTLSYYHQTGGDCVYVHGVGNYTEAYLTPAAAAGWFAAELIAKATVFGDYNNPPTGPLAAAMFPGLPGTEITLAYSYDQARYTITVGGKTTHYDYVAAAALAFARKVFNV